MARRPRRRIQLDGPPALAVHIVLDESSSMASVLDDTIGGINQYLETLRREEPTALVSLTLFSDAERVRSVFTNTPVTEVQPLTRTTYVPNGWTALFDGIGRGVEALDAAVAQNKALIIMTDGGENNSRVHTREGIRDLLLDRQEHHNWLVSYLAANQDAFAVGQSFGTLASHTMNVSQTSRGMAGTFASASAATVRYARSGGDLRVSSYTDEERANAADEGDDDAQSS